MLPLHTEAPTKEIRSSASELYFSSSEELDMNFNRNAERHFCPLWAICLHLSSACSHLRVSHAEGVRSHREVLKYLGVDLHTLKANVEVFLELPVCSEVTPAFPPTPCPGRSHEADGCLIRRPNLNM